MEYKLILKELEENYGWTGTKEFTEMQKELVTDVAKIVSGQLEPLVMPKFTASEETIIKALLVSKMIEFVATMDEHIFMDDKEKERLQKQLDYMQTILSKFSV